MRSVLPDFEWTRFWVPREGQLFLDDDGFLADPAGKHGRFLNPDAVPVTEVLSRRCAVLLGEPGIGKSTELERVNRQGASAPTHAQVLELNLNEYSSDSSFIRELFDNPKVREWAAGSHELVLSLDSLDECMLRVETVANLLSSRLGRYPVDRLWLRIACRTAVWALLQPLEETLEGLWKEQFGVFELLPLRRKDVEATAEAFGLQPETFVSEVISRKAVPFALKPLTLRFLIETFRRDRRLPDRIEDIYLEGCRSLCTEANPSRVSTSQTGKLTPIQRLAVAGRLAALTVFAGRTAISQEAPALQAEGDLSIHEAALGGTEEENGQSVDVTPAAIREVLDTGLFSARGPSRLGWAHQTYGEFLAARYVIRHGFNTTQIISLITHPGYSSRLVIPQLVQTTVCLVNLNPALFNELVQDSPHVLLRSEASAWDSSQKSELTASFLRNVAELKLTDSDAEIWRSFEKLGHGELASQLEPYIRDRTANPVVRRVAIGIAEACHAVQLRESLLEVALDRSDHQPTRVQAIRALQEVGDHETRQRLASLLSTELEEDDDDQIRGVVLRQAWPGLLTFGDLVQYLTATKEHSFIGAYWVFLKYELAKGLRPADIPQALAWAGAQEGWRGTLSPLSAAADSIIRVACRYIDDPIILASLTDIMERRLKTHHSLWEDGFDEFEEDPFQGERKRHRLIQALVERASDAPSLERLQIIHRLGENNFHWLLEQFLRAATKSDQEKWAPLVQQLFVTDIKRYSNLALENAHKNKALADLLSFWIDPIAIDSPNAEFQRDLWQRSQSSATSGQKEELDLESLLQQIDLVLQKKGDGKEIWLRLDPLLGDLQRREWNADLRRNRTWQHLDAERRSKVVKEAQRHILTGEDPSNGSMSGSFNGVELASFRALYLACSESPDFCRLLDQDVIEKWIPIILRKPGIVDDEAEPYRELLRLVAQRAPDLVAKKLYQAIDEQNQVADDNSKPHLSTQLQECWSDRIEFLLFEKMKSGTLKRGFASYLMEVLIKNGSKQARQWAIQLLSSPIPEEQKEQEYQLELALRLIFVEGDNWAPVWKRITNLAQLQDHLTERTVDFLYWKFEEGLFSSLPGPQLGEIGSWVRKFAPDETASIQHGPAAITGVFRGQFLSYLQKAGTPEALCALQQMVNAEPADTGLKWMLAEAHKALLQQSWLPPQPSEILEMARRADARLVDSGERLLEVVMESLERLQRKLHGHTPRVDYLWNRWSVERGVEKWQPKDENSLSNFVVSHLEDDLRNRNIVLNREVEIRRSLGREIRQGQETDIQIDAVASKPRSGEQHRVTVIIEVKGCWNRELKTAMKEQLVDRYLAESSCQHGLYLVGWFLCEAWDRQDYRKGDTPEWSLQHAREHFQEQAAGLSQGGLLIRSFVLDAELR